MKNKLDVSRFIEINEIPQAHNLDTWLARETPAQANSA